MDYGRSELDRQYGRKRGIACHCAEIDIPLVVSEIGWVSTGEALDSICRGGGLPPLSLKECRSKVEVRAPVFRSQAE